MTATALALLALLAVVVLASRNGFGRSSNAATPTAAYADYGFSLFLIAFALMIPVAIWAYAVQFRASAGTRAGFVKRVGRGILGVLIVFGVIALFVYAHHHHGLGHNGTLFEAPGTGRGHAPGGHVPYRPRFRWPVLWLALALLAAGTAWVYVVRRRQETPSVPAAEVAVDLAASMTDAIDDLEAEPDARRAVIAAYARMVGVLTRHGLARAASETPLEYLARALGAITRRADAVTRLTALFERAKFSTHDVDAAMKSEAIAALREIRDDLAAPV